MMLRVAAIGQRMPQGVDTAWREYARRFPGNLNLELRELPMERRGKNPDIARLREREGEALMAAVPAGAMPVALDIGGRQWSTTKLASNLERWMSEGRDACFLIGGPDGLSQAGTDRAESSWSLGPLTLPHPLVRVIVAEQLYRAWTILSNHPYHRA
jgi:23S rRNA (pseudouridine1915-N3)-methyltransferase